MKISFIGSGNVATHLAKACVNAGIQVENIYSLTFENAQSLANEVNARAVENIKDLNPKIDFLILAVKDDVIESLAETLEFATFPIVHTAGSVSIDVLNSDKHSFGVLYPLQTFSKTKQINIKELPFLIEASDSTFKETLNKFVDKLQAKKVHANSEQRLHMHIAAVFACNFTNHFYSIAEKMLQEQHLPFDLLKPLIMETADKIKNISPKEAQTGPAKRKDINTMQKHLVALNDKSTLLMLYKAISEDIEKNQNS